MENVCHTLSHEDHGVIDECITSVCIQYNIHILIMPSKWHWWALDLNRKCGPAPLGGKLALTLTQAILLWTIPNLPNPPTYDIKNAFSRNLQKSSNILYTTWNEWCPLPQSSQILQLVKSKTHSASILQNLPIFCTLHEMSGAHCLNPPKSSMNQPLTRKCSAAVGKLSHESFAGSC